MNRLVGKILLGIPASLLCLVILIYAIDLSIRFKNFKQLDKDDLVEGAEAYITTRLPVSQGTYGACLYVVDCGDENAKLRSVENFDALNFEALKGDIWKRRVNSTYCQGRATNIGIAAIPLSPDAEELRNGRKLAVWSFYNDRFIPSQTHFHGYAFGFDFAPCTPDKLIVEFTGN